MRRTRPERPRPTVDRLMLAVVVICIGIAVVRLALVVAVVPYAVYLDRSETAQAAAAGSAEPTRSVTSRIVHSRPVSSWWGGRRFPRRAGGDYLDVLSNSSSIRTLGAVIGVVAEQLRAEGAVVRRVIVPSDVNALYGRPSGTLMVLADGTEVRTPWASLARQASFLSAVPVTTQSYDPLLTPAQAEQLASDTRLTERSVAFRVGDPLDGDSGTWIVLAQVVETHREFLMVPIESSPIGGSR